MSHCWDAVLQSRVGLAENTMVTVTTTGYTSALFPHMYHYCKHKSQPKNRKPIYSNETSMEVVEFSHNLL